MKNGRELTVSIKRGANFIELTLNNKYCYLVTKKNFKVILLLSSIKDKCSLNCMSKRNVCYICNFRFNRNE